MTSVACCDAQGRVTVNGVPLSEQSYLYPGDAPSDAGSTSSCRPAGCGSWATTGSYSDDSRDHMGDPGGGTIPESAVLGRAFVIIWPLSRWRFLPIPATFEQPKLNAGQRRGGPGRPGPARLARLARAVPLSLGFAGALPLTWVQRRVRLRISRRRQRRRDRALRCPRRGPRHRRTGVICGVS